MDVLNILVKLIGLSIIFAGICSIPFCISWVNGFKKEKLRRSSTNLVAFGFTPLLTIFVTMLILKILGVSLPPVGEALLWVWNLIF